MDSNKKNKEGSPSYSEKYELSKKEIDKVLTFTDFLLYENKTLINSLLYYPNKNAPTKIDSSNIKLFKYFIREVKKAYLKFNKKEDFIVFFEGRSFRACAMRHTVQGTVFALRQTNVDYNDFFNLKLGKTVEKELMHERLNKGGLIIIAGSPGNGKTTTSSALVISRLKEYSGVCITIEDPPEFPLMGIHGSGLCIQNQAEEGHFDKAIRTSMRSYPTGQNSLMFIGEIRDSETAIEAIKASIDGRLVIVTIHSNNVFNAIKRLANLAHSAIGEEAYNMLGESFRIAIHQELRMKKTGNSYQMNVDFLVNNTASVNNIKNNQIEMLRNQLDYQSKRFLSGKNIAYHDEKKDD